jgi:S-adenosylmethionine/arginine decarboxylase-like enzyme
MTATPPNYGYELVLDLHDCEPETFTRKSLNAYFTSLCKEIGMQKCKVHFWDDVGVLPEEQQTLAHTKGTSAVCFILTSSIVIHTLDIMCAVYVNIFSCKDFDREKAQCLTEKWFNGRCVRSSWVERF